MSDEGWKKSLSIELKMKKEQGLENNFSSRKEFMENSLLERNLI